MQNSDGELRYMFQSNPLKKLGVFQFSCEETKPCDYCHKETKCFYQLFIYKNISTCEDCIPKVIEEHFK